MRANKVRTGLTVLGMVIGIAAVIIVFSAGEGINSLVKSEIESFGGSDLIHSEIKLPSSKKGIAAETESRMSLVMGAQVTTLNLDDMDDINKLPNIKRGYGGVLGQEQVSYGSELKKAVLYGISSDFINIDKSEVGNGRFFSEAEDKSLAQVVVLGSKIKDKLFGDSDPIGQSIKIRKKKFRVIGVLKERGAVMGFDLDDLVYMPVRTLQKKIMGIDYIVYIISQVEDAALVDETAEEIRYILRENHGIEQPTDKGQGLTDTSKDDFLIASMIEVLGILNTVTNTITILLLAIVAISLVVGGVGIMNIMYVIVNERTREIGLRKAVGAKYSEILKQFLMESILITIIGGVIGIIVGVFVSYLIAVAATSAGMDWAFSVPLRAFVIALGFSFIFGILFGVYPARKAARMDPIEALRSE